MLLRRPEILVILIIFFSFGSCKPKVEKEEVVKKPDPDEIIDADLAFSDMCRQKDMKTAFIHFIDDEGVLLRPYSPPLKGDKAIDYLSQMEQDGYSLSWIPEGAEIAEAGDQGYTYGIFTLEAPDTTYKGTYLNIWKKQADGNWKFTLNTTNQGIEP